MSTPNDTPPPSSLSDANSAAAPGDRPVPAPSDRPDAAAGARSATPGLSRKEQRRKAQRRQWAIIASILALVVLVVVGVVVYTKSSADRIDTLPADQRLIVTVGDSSTEVAPYIACELDDPECPEGTPTPVKVSGVDAITLGIPADVADHDWSLLKIYDEHAANEDNYFKGNERSEVKVETTVPPLVAEGPRPKLQVVEVHSMLIGLDAAGEQTPVKVVWALEITH